LITAALTQGNIRTDDPPVQTFTEHRAAVPYVKGSVLSLQEGRCSLSHHSRIMSWRHTSNGMLYCEQTSFHRCKLGFLSRISFRHELHTCSAINSSSPVKYWNILGRISAGNTNTLVCTTASSCRALEMPPVRSGIDTSMSSTCSSSAIISIRARSLLGGWFASMVSICDNYENERCR